MMVLVMKSRRAAVALNKPKHQSELYRNPNNLRLAPSSDRSPPPSDSPRYSLFLIPPSSPKSTAVGYICRGTVCGVADVHLYASLT
ncbi:hypothetical protein J6590_033682 [Homalodisca vitripennis]|nr:hypothetical protein J6590_033682 [Homalodisca vitripennis]